MFNKDISTDVIIDSLMKLINAVHSGERQFNDCFPEMAFLLGALKAKYHNDVTNSIPALEIICGDGDKLSN